MHVLRGGMRDGDRRAGGLDLARRPARRHLRVHAGTTRVGDLGSAAARQRSRARRGAQPRLARPRPGHHRLVRRRADPAQRSAGRERSLPAAPRGGQLRARHRVLRASPRDLVARRVSRALRRAAERRLPPGARRGGRRRRHALDPPAGRVRHCRRPGAHQGGGRRGARRRRPRSGARRQFHGARLGLLRRRAACRAAPVVVRLEEAGGRAAPRGARHARVSAQRPRPCFPRAGLSPRPGDRRQPRLARRGQGRRRDRAALPRRRARAGGRRALSPARRPADRRQRDGSHPRAQHPARAQVRPR